MGQIKKVKEDVFWREHSRQLSNGDIVPIIQHFKLREINAETIKAPSRAGERTGTYRVSINRYGRNNKNERGWVDKLVREDDRSVYQIEALSIDKAKEKAIRLHGDEALNKARSGIETGVLPASTEFEIEEQQPYGVPENSVDIDLSEMIKDNTIGWFFVENPRTDTSKPVSLSKGGYVFRRYLRTNKDGELSSIWLEITNPSKFSGRGKRNRNDSVILESLRNENPKEIKNAFVIYRQYGKGYPAKPIAVIGVDPLTKDQKKKNKQDQSKAKATNMTKAANKTAVELRKHLKLGEDEARGIITKSERKSKESRLKGQFKRDSSELRNRKKNADQYYDDWINKPENYKVSRNEHQKNAVHASFRQQYIDYLDLSKKDKKKWQVKVPKVLSDVKGYDKREAPIMATYGVRKDYWEITKGSDEEDRFNAFLKDEKQFKKRFKRS